MILVTHEQLQSVLPWSQRDLSLGLAGAEMQMIEIVGNGLIERWKLGVDQQMVMTRILTIRACRRDTHVPQAEEELQLRGNGRSVPEIDEIDLGSLTRWRRTSRSLGLSQSNAAGRCDRDDQQCCEAARTLAGLASDLLELVHRWVLPWLPRHHSLTKRSTFRAIRSIIYGNSISLGRRTAKRHADSGKLFGLGCGVESHPIKQINGKTCRHAAMLERRATSYPCCPKPRTRLQCYDRWQKRLQAESDSEVFRGPTSEGRMGEPIDMEQSGCLYRGPTC